MLKVGSVAGEACLAPTVNRIIHDQGLSEDVDDATWSRSSIDGFGTIRVYVRLLLKLDRGGIERRILANGRRIAQLPTR
jgi:hypothetical protein